MKMRWKALITGLVYCASLGGQSVQEASFWVENLVKINNKIKPAIPFCNSSLGQGESKKVTQCAQFFEKGHNHRSRYGWHIRALGSHIVAEEILKRERPAINFVNRNIIPRMLNDKWIGLKTKLVRALELFIYQNSSVMLKQIIETDEFTKWLNEQKEPFKEKWEKKKKSFYPLVNVGVMDTGIDSSHPYLEGRMPLGSKSRERVIKRFLREPVVTGHGTHVAGTIVSVGPTAVVSSYSMLGSSSDALLFYQEAIDEGMQLLNGSWGYGTMPSKQDAKPLADLIEATSNRGQAIHIMASGNSGNLSRANNLFPESISTASLSESGNRSYFSQNNPDFASFGEVIFAPMAKNMTKKNERSIVYLYQGTEGIELVGMRGTSMSSPNLTGLSSIALSVMPNLHKRELYQLLEVASHDLGKEGKDSISGHGIANAVTVWELANGLKAWPRKNPKLALKRKKILDSLNDPGTHPNEVEKLLAELSDVIQSQRDFLQDKKKSFKKLAKRSLKQAKKILKKIEGGRQSLDEYCEQYEKMLSLFEKSYLLNPRNDEVRHILAKHSLKLGQFSDFIRYQAGIKDRKWSVPHDKFKEYLDKNLKENPRKDMAVGMTEVLLQQADSNELKAKLLINLAAANELSDDLSIPSYINEYLHKNPSLYKVFEREFFDSEPKAQNFALKSFLTVAKNFDIIIAEKIIEKSSDTQIIIRASLDNSGDFKERLLKKVSKKVFENGGVKKLNEWIATPSFDLQMRESDIVARKAALEKLGDRDSYNSFFTYLEKTFSTGLFSGIRLEKLTVVEKEIVDEIIAENLLAFDKFDVAMKTVYNQKICDSREDEIMLSVLEELQRRGDNSENRKNIAKEMEKTIARIVRNNPSNGCVELLNYIRVMLGLEIYYDISHFQLDPEIALYDIYRRYGQKVKKLMQYENPLLLMGEGSTEDLFSNIPVDAGRCILFLRSKNPREQGIEIKDPKVKKLYKKTIKEDNFPSIDSCIELMNWRSWPDDIFEKFVTEKFIPQLKLVGHDKFIPLGSLLHFFQEFCFSGDYISAICENKDLLAILDRSLKKVLHAPNTKGDFRYLITDMPGSSRDNSFHIGSTEISTAFRFNFIRGMGNDTSIRRLIVENFLKKDKEGNFYILNDLDKTKAIFGEKLDFALEVFDKFSKIPLDSESIDLLAKLRKSAIDLYSKDPKEENIVLHAGYIHSNKLTMNEKIQYAENFFDNLKKTLKLNGNGHKQSPKTHFYFDVATMPQVAMLDRLGLTNIRNRFLSEIGVTEKQYHVLPARDDYRQNRKKHFFTNIPGFYPPTKEERKQFNDLVDEFIKIINRPELCTQDRVKTWLKMFADNRDKTIGRGRNKVVTSTAQALQGLPRLAGALVKNVKQLECIIKEFKFYDVLKSLENFSERGKKETIKNIVRGLESSSEIKRVIINLALDKDFTYEDFVEFKNIHNKKWLDPHVLGILKARILHDISFSPKIQRTKAIEILAEVLPSFVYKNGLFGATENLEMSTILQLLEDVRSPLDKPQKQMIIKRAVQYLEDENTSNGMEKLVDRLKKSKNLEIKSFTRELLTQREINFEVDLDV